MLRSICAGLRIRPGLNRTDQSQADETARLEAANSAEHDFQLERYKYLLQQIHAVNENVYRFLGIYQTLAVTLMSGGLALFIGYRRWGIHPSVARAGIIGLLSLLSIVAIFTSLLIVVGAFNWLDYRKEECELTDSAVRPGFRTPPKTGNFLRWYETYILLFIIGSAAFLWACTLRYILPVMN